MDQSRKVLVLFAHPGQRYSKANDQLAKVASDTRGVIFADLYADYPRFKIDVETEQDRLLTHDATVFQFPLFWYSTPALLKEWQDLVLEYGFAYGEGDDKIAGKLFLPVITAGGPQEFYRIGGRNNYSLRDLLRPLEQTANLCDLRFVPPYALFAALRAPGDDRLGPPCAGLCSAAASIARWHTRSGSCFGHGASLRRKPASARGGQDMTGLLFQAFIYLCVAVIAVPLASRLGLGSVLGYLIAGIVIGPALGLVGSETQGIQHVTEFGVVMMLFLVGLELEPRNLWNMRNRLLGLGGFQSA